MTNPAWSLSAGCNIMFWTIMELPKENRHAYETVLVCSPYRGLSTTPGGTCRVIIKKVGNGWFWSSHTPKNRIFSKGTSSRFFLHLKSEFCDHENLSKSFLYVLKAPTNNLENFCTLIPHYTHFFADFHIFRLFWPISRLFRLRSKNLVFEPCRN